MGTCDMYGKPDHVMQGGPSIFVIQLKYHQLKN